MFETPILFIIFNRPEITQRVFEEIRKQKPKFLFVAADGARPNNLQDIERCKAARDLVINRIDWHCEVKTLFRDENLGCGKAVSEAITWFFGNVEQGIILEDDCLPHPSFFDFCHKMLDYYKDSSDIMHISGSCYGKSSKKYDYYFTRLPFIWGWATWKRAWDLYDFNLKFSTPQEKHNVIKKAFNNDDIVQYWDCKLNDFHLLPTSYTWDYQWFLTIWNAKGLVIQPSVNLIKNIGFGVDATHTTLSNHFLGKVRSKELIITSFHSIKTINEVFQNQNFYFYFNVKISKSITNKLKKAFNKLLRKIKFLGAKLVFKFLDFYSYNFFSYNVFNLFKSFADNSKISNTAKLFPVYKILNSEIEDFTYVSRNSVINNTTIGKFCSIGPNLVCGWGVHPTNGVSTHPMFYSTTKLNGFSLSSVNKINEFKKIIIGNDVFIGMNVTILDGVSIGDGAVIGAGSVVSKNIPPYAIAVGNPIKIIKYRFEEEQIERLLKISWWNSSAEKLALVEEYFFEIEKFIQIFEDDNRNIENI